MKRTQDDLVHELSNQQKLVRAAAAEFDSGEELAARWLSTCIRILVHDTNKSHSLLGQLGIKEKLEYVDTAIEPGDLMLTSGLTITELSTDGSASYLPPLGGGPPVRNKPPVDFGRWWNTKIVRDQESNLFSRKDLVLAVANTDGGTHVDPQLEVAYAALSRSNSLGWFVSHGDAPRSLGDPVPASIRQISYELEQTLANQALKLLGADEA